MTTFDQVAMVYCLNAVWLVPVVAGAAWVLVKLAGLRPAGEHRVWLGALAVCLVLPAAGIRVPSRTSIAQPQPADEGVARLVPATAEAAVAESARPLGPIVAEPSPKRWPLREVSVAPVIARWFAWMYAAVVGFAAFRIARSWSAARRLLRQAKPYVGNDAADALLRELAMQFDVAVPEIVQSERVLSPVLLGFWRPMLMLPADFDGYSEAERRAALCHEMAHLRRRDCLVHGLVQGLMLPLAWHPAIHLVARRIARTREMACDGMAARAMSASGGELLYARCLLHLAQTMVRPELDGRAEAGLGLLRTNKLEERMMRLTEVKQVLTIRQMWVRRVGGGAVAGTIAIAGTMVHVEPVVARQSGPVAPVEVRLPAEAPVGAALAAPISQSASPAPVASAHPQAPSSSAAPPVQAVPESLSATPQAVGGGSAVGYGPSGTAAGTDVFEDDHFAVARGRNAHVQVSNGRYLHRWVGTDGEPYESADENPGDPTAEQKRATEAEFARRMARLDAQVAFWKSPAYKQQLRQQASEEAALEEAEAEAAAAGAALNAPEIKAQMRKLNSPEFKAQMDAQLKTLRTQLAHLDGTLSPERLDVLTATLDAKLADAERQAVLLDTPAMQRKLDEAAKRLDGASARLDAAAKALDAAQKRFPPQ